MYLAVYLLTQDTIVRGHDLCTTVRIRHPLMTFEYAAESPDKIK